MSIKIDPDSGVGKLLAEFWQQLQKNPGTRAELRRCKDISEVMMTPAYHHFCQRIKPLMAEAHDWQSSFAALIGLLSHLKSEKVLEKSKGSKSSYAALCALAMAKPQGERPQVSELRFRRLLQRDRSDLYPAMIRVIRMLDGNVNLYGLAESVYYWGDRIKKEWAFAYFPRVPQKSA
ncbi:MAG: type I-E CRISPR-associated protein Cse2/CasB [Gammaproteobacteria bacterium]|nr:type I-E CRISPR-associated protein Cse2/CasB [Gammaproteobacteria bacterium]